MLQEEAECGHIRAGSKGWAHEPDTLQERACSSARAPQEGKQRTVRERSPSAPPEVPEPQLCMLAVRLEEGAQQRSILGYERPDLQ
jgi:hypothetical protein